jgi:hypothetical protein
VSRAPAGLDISFSVLRGQNGKKTDSWKVICRGVREAKLTDLDGGGLRLYTAHPAAQQYTLPRAQLSWNGAVVNADEMLGVLYQAHWQEVDDWIPFDRYTKTKDIGAKKVVWQGPLFLMRAYANALRTMGLQVALKRQAKTSRQPALKVLHFGESYIVAATYKAQHQTS